MRRLTQQKKHTHEEQLSLKTGVEKIVQEKESFTFHFML